MQNTFRHLHTTILPSTTFAASVAETMVDLKLAGYKYIVATLDITAAERDSSDELYDVYLVMGDGKAKWDIAHFTQVATTGAKRMVMRISAERIAEVTGATPGIVAEPPAILLTSSTNAPGSLGSGIVRHGPFADFIGVKVVVAGTVATGIVCSLDITAGG